MRSIRPVLDHPAWSAFALTFALGGAGIAPAHAARPFSFDATPGTLPKDIVPIEYDVRLVPDIASHTLAGTQTVQIQVRRRTRAIVMNALDMDVGAATLVGPDGHALELPVPSADAKRQTVSYPLAKPLEPGRYSLRMSWHGHINTSPQGMYYDDYPTPAGQRTLLGTEMEPADARRMMPCWDEPSFRARFRLSADIPASFEAFSNMPLVRTEPLAGDLKRVSFDATPPMASYLVAFAAGDFRRTAARAGATEIGVVATAGKEDSTAFALDAARQVLDYYNDYFEQRFPLPKLDQIAMPGGFPGAMENWGAIIYNESNLLVDPQHSPEGTRRRVFNVSAHEIAHQWFGDLVTMAWWDDLWLNEGFATWMASKATDHFNPQWHESLSAVHFRAEALNLDALKTSHPIQQPVKNESEANDAFDAITYEKGGAFLRMLESYLGEATFRTGLRAYMAKHRYSNTTTADLWAALGKASGKPVARIASDWTMRTGFPVLDVDSRCVGGARLVRLHQEQFTSDGRAPGGRLWNVPVQVATLGANAPDWVLMRGRTAQVRAGACDAVAVIDPHDDGFYRVNYSAGMREALLAHWTELPDGARMKLVDDGAALARAGRMPLGGYFAMLARLQDEPRVAVWRSALDSLGALADMARGSPAQAQVDAFAIRLASPRLARLGLDEKPGEPIEDTELRGELLLALGFHGDAATIEWARKRFAQYAADPQSLPPSLVAPVLAIAGMTADQPTFEALRRMGREALGTERKWTIYDAMFQARDPAIVKQVLELSLGNELPVPIRNRMARAVAEHGGRAQAWAFAVEHAQVLMRSRAGMFLDEFFPSIMAESYDAADADTMLAYVAKHMPPEAMSLANRAADGIRARAAEKSRLMPQLASAIASSS